MNKGTNTVTKGTKTSNGGDQWWIKHRNVSPTDRYTANQECSHHDTFLTFVSWPAGADVTRGLGVVELSVEDRPDVGRELLDDLGLVQRGVGPLEADPVVLAGGLPALCHIRVTVLPCVSFEASAGVIVDPVLAGGVVHAGARSALVDVVLAVLAFETGPVATALVRVDPVQAHAAIKTRHVRALVYVHLRKRKCFNAISYSVNA